MKSYVQLKNLFKCIGIVIFTIRCLIKVWSNRHLHQFHIYISRSNLKFSPWITFVQKQALVIHPNHHLRYFMKQKFVGQNFPRSKCSVEQNFLHLIKISQILPEEYSCPTNLCPKLWLGVIHVFAAFWTKTSKDSIETFLQETLVEISAL